MPLKIITAPTIEPVTLAEARAALQLDADNTADNTHIEDVLIPGARAEAEQETGLALILRTLELGLDEFPGADPIPLVAPLVAITSVKYYDTAGVLQTLDSATYLLDEHSKPPRLYLAPDQVWPSTQARSNAVLVRFTAGVALSTDVPKNIKAYMLAHIKAAYRGESLGPFVVRLLDSSKVYA